jgi:hypothetical protein
MTSWKAQGCRTSGDRAFSWVEWRALELINARCLFSKGHQDLEICQIWRNLCILWRRTEKGNSSTDSALTYGRWQQDFILLVTCANCRGLGVQCFSFEQHIHYSSVIRFYVQTISPRQVRGNCFLDLTRESTGSEHGSSLKLRSL